MEEERYSNFHLFLNLSVAGDKESFYKDWGYDKRDLWARYSQCAIVNCGAILDHSKITKIKGKFSSFSLSISILPPPFRLFILL